MLINQSKIEFAIFITVASNMLCYTGFNTL
jgi:hypothetical protein